MLFVYIVAAVLAGLVSYGSALLFGYGLDEELLRGNNGLAMFISMAISIGALVAVWFLLVAAYEELVYWDFHINIRNWCYYFILNRLPKDAVYWDIKGWYEHNSSWHDHRDIFHSWYR